MFKNNQFSNLFFFLLIGITFLLKVWSIFHLPFDEDELDYVRTAFLMKEGYLPFRDYLHLSFPLFAFLLTPFVYFISDPVICIFTIKLVFLCLSYLGLCFYYKTINNWIPSKIAILATVIFSLSYIFYSQIFLIRPSTLLFPILLFCFWFITKNPGYCLKSVFISILFTFSILLEPRSCAFIFAIFTYGIIYNKLSWKVSLYSLLLIIFISCAVLFYMNPLVFKILIQMSYFFPTHRPDQSILNLINFWSYDWIFCFLSLKGGEVFLDDQKSKMKFISLIILYSLIAFYLLSSLRPETFSIYIVPFFSFFCAIGLNGISAVQRNQNAVLLLFTVIFVGSSLTPFKKPYTISLKNQIEIIKTVHKNNNPSVMNLGRFSLNLFSPLYHPIIRFEEDVLFSMKKAKMEMFFYGLLFQQLIAVSPEWVIYSGKDDHTDARIKAYIYENYTLQSPYLYHLKTQESKIIQKQTNSQILIKIFEELERMYLLTFNFNKS